MAVGGPVENLGDGPVRPLHRTVSGPIPGALSSGPAAPAGPGARDQHTDRHPGTPRSVHTDAAVAALRDSRLCDDDAEWRNAAAARGGVPATETRDLVHRPRLAAAPHG
ncbi:hypothetical protein J2Z21_009074 [Streptomyces griseochromogenes]|uniref:Uncharacterized protein n=1 Tax=Streptomyces griseochromogenes TaxID=68214 RepID=A0A1B1AYA6_9ACTN|nr:hypothetical protein [Streptomyces griseochromogenes]ANP51549.1 hypothetical protein AVL59_19790 [Streptomyces griseochromogenes]MBP2056057.1 hypothetical protein [Streptomyces griseochromogenes]